MSATFEHKAADAVLVVRGEIDLANAGELDAALGALGEAHGAITIDLSATEYLDSAGVKVLFEHARRARLRVVLTPETIVAAVVHASRLDRVAAVEILPS